jgi:septum formation protein
MLQPLILASQSPRRRELMLLLNLPYSSENPNVEEVVRTDIKLEKAIEELAYLKAADVLSRHPHAIVIGSDTVVVVDGEVLGKPANPEEGKTMLRKLSGRKHHVITAVAVLTESQKTIFHSKAEVEFYPLDDAWIDSYIASGSPLDKAGAYGIQDRGALMVKSIKGDFYTIMGLPIARVNQVLKTLKGSV